MPARGDARTPLAEILAAGTDDDGVGKDHLDLRVVLKEIPDRREGSGKVLFIAVDVGKDFTLGAAETPVDRVIHAAILFDEGADAGVVRQPVLRPVV